MAKKKHMCGFPGCGKFSLHLAEFDDHHIRPRSQGGTEAAWNKLTCCPGCHRRIHVPTAKHGIHALKLPDGIVVHGYIMTSGGKGLHYTRLEDGKECVWIYTECELIVLKESLLA
jgi:hypothetical protein